MNSFAWLSKGILWAPVYSCSGLLEISSSLSLDPGEMTSTKSQAGVGDQATGPGFTCALLKSQEERKN